jgi:hypothetical protein
MLVTVGKEETQRHDEGKTVLHEVISKHFPQMLGGPDVRT